MRNSAATGRYIPAPALSRATNALPSPAPQLVAVNRHLDDAPHVRIPELELGVTPYRHLLGNYRKGLRA